MKVLFIVAALFLAKAYGGVINAKCEFQRFDKCTDAFAKALGLPSMPTDASILDAQIKKLLNQGPSGKQQVCNAGDGLEKCLGDEYDQCMTVEYLMSLGVSQKDAQQFVAESKQLDQMCTAVALKANEKCDNNRFSQCTDTFAKALGLSAMPTDAQKLVDQINKLISGGQLTQVCKANSDLTKCLGNQFSSCISVDYLKSIGESDKDAQLFVFEAGVLHFLCTSSSNAQCDNNRFAQCTDTFAKALGLPQMPTDSQTLIDRINKLIDDGKKDDVCKADNAMISCLGDQYDSCISVDYLKSIGESDKDARAFVFEAAALKVTCTSSANAQCDNNRFSQCTDTFAKALGLPAMPTSAQTLIDQITKLMGSGKEDQVCNADQALIKCLGDQYTSCISTDYLKSIGESELDAQLFVMEAQYLQILCTPSANAQCDNNRFGQCTDTFAKALGLPAMPASADTLIAQVGKLLGDGKRTQVCNADKALIQCLGDQYDSCISVDYLKSIGESDYDAAQFVGEAHFLKSLCSQSANAQCDNGRFSQCTDTFAKALGLPAMPTDAKTLYEQITKLLQGGHQDQVCNADKALVQCLGDQYSSCISVDYLKSIGESETDAQLFVIEAQLLQTLCSSSANAQCDASCFSQCTDTFAKALGLPFMPTDAQTLIDQINKLLGQGPSGKVQVCGADKDLQKCLNDQYDSCISVAFLKSIGESDSDAKKFVDEAKSLKQMCA